MNATIPKSPPSGKALLDLVSTMLDRGDAARGLHLLYEGLGALREQMGPEEWERFAQSTVPTHPLCARIHEDPACRHSFEKPRGYPGDAELIDHLYGLRDAAGASDLGQTVNAWAMGRSPVRGVRYRREWLAHVIDDVARQRRGEARVLSVACGHLREAALSTALRCGWLEELVALDSDQVSLDEAVAVDPAIVTPVKMSVARLPNRAGRLGTFDLVYSAGLYDYLDERLARALTTALFGVLRPGGRLVVGNFLTGVADSAYMETFMGWSLNYRTQQEIEALTEGAPEDSVAFRRFHRDPFGVFGYVEVGRVEEPEPAP
ncbi:MAG: class I SAM-dependent methyltransferase [Planctomycetota bacterium]